jgi:Fe-S cluster biogenesis protein NfuA
MTGAGDPRKSPMTESIERICREILAPLVRTDGGELYFVGQEADEVRIHLSGACSGCPGASMTGDKVLLPALRSALPKVRLVITTGVKIPAGARKF